LAGAWQRGDDHERHKVPGRRQNTKHISRWVKSHLISVLSKALRCASPEGTNHKGVSQAFIFIGRFGTELDAVPDEMPEKIVSFLEGHGCKLRSVFSDSNCTSTSPLAAGIRTLSSIIAGLGPEGPPAARS
jgi:hypothetical protein